MKATFFGNIPALARKYHLYNIKPIASNGLWSEKAVKWCNDFFFNKYVKQRRCDLIVIDRDDNEATAATIQCIETCRIELFTKDKDLGTALISRGYAQLIHQEDNN